MKVTFFWILLFCFNCSFAQNYFEYQTVITEAELQITEGNINKAIRLYDSAFSLVPDHFSKDYNNIALCHMKMKHYPTAVNYCLKMVSIGVEPSFFLRRKAYNKLRNTPEWKRFTDSSAIYHQRFLDSSLYFLNDRLNQLVDMDQKYRKKPGSYNVWRDTIAYLDSLIMLEIKHLYKQYGYLGDRQLGGVPDGHLNYYVIIRHHYQNKKYDLSEFLYQAVKNGLMEPQIFAELEDKRYGNRKYGTVVYFVNKNKWYELPLAQPEIEKMDQNRKEIGIGTVEQYKRIVKYSKNNNGFIFQTFEGAVMVPKSMIESVIRK